MISRRRLLRGLASVAALGPLALRRAVRVQSVEEQFVKAVVEEFGHLTIERGVSVGFIRAPFSTQDIATADELRRIREEVECALLYGVPERTVPVGLLSSMEQA